MRTREEGFGEGTEEDQGGSREKLPSRLEGRGRHICNLPAHWRQRQEDFCESEASLWSRTVRAT